MEFANVLLKNSVKEPEKKEEEIENVKKVEDEKRGFYHSNEVFIIKSKDKRMINRLGYIKSRISSKWNILLKNDEWVDSKVGNVVKGVDSKKIIVKDIKSGESIEKEMKDYKELILFKKNDLVSERELRRWGLDERVKLRSDIKYLGEIEGDKINVLKSKVTDTELKNEIAKMVNLLGMRSEKSLLNNESLKEYLSTITGYDRSLVERKIRKLEGNREDIRVSEDIKGDLLEKVEFAKENDFKVIKSIKKEKSESSIEELIEDILEKKDLRIEEGNIRIIMEDLYYLRDGDILGELERIKNEKYLVEKKEEIWISPKNVEVIRGDNVKIKNGRYKGKSGRVLKKLSESFVLEINGKKFGDILGKKISRENFIYADVIYNGKFSEVEKIVGNVLSIKYSEGGKNDIIKREVKEYEVINNGLRLKEEDGNVEYLNEESISYESGFKDKDRVDISYIKSKEDVEIKKKLDSLLKITKLNLSEEDLNGLVGEVRMLLNEVIESVKGSEYEEYTTLNSSMVKYIYVIVLYREALKFGVSNMGSLKEVSDYLKEKKYLKESDGRKNYWLDGVKNSDKIYEMLKKSWDYVSERLGEVEWRKNSGGWIGEGEELVKLGKRKRLPADTLVSKNYVKKGNKEYILATVGKLYDSKDTSDTTEERIKKRMKEELYSKHLEELRKNMESSSLEEGKRAEMNSKLYNDLYMNVDNLSESLKKLSLKENKNKYEKKMYDNLGRIDKKLKKELSVNDESWITNDIWKKITNNDIKREINEKKGKEEIVKDVNRIKKRTLWEFKEGLKLKKENANSESESKMYEKIIENMDDLENFINELNESGKGGELVEMSMRILEEINEKVSERLKDGMVEWVKEDYDYDFDNNLLSDVKRQKERYDKRLSKMLNKE